jgi:hypothetical protein
VTHFGLQYIVRCIDYGLIRRLRLLEKLAELPAEDFQMPDPGTHRMLHDAGVVQWQGTRSSHLVLQSPGSSSAFARPGPKRAASRR